MYPSAVPTSINFADVAVADSEVMGPAKVSFGGLRQERVPISTWAAEKDGKMGLVTRAIWRGFNVL